MDNSKKIDELYDNFIEKADSLLKNAINDKSVEEISNLEQQINCVVGDDLLMPEYTTEVAVSNGASEPVKVISTYDPITGDQTVDSNKGIQYINNLTSTHWNNFTSDGKEDSKETMIKLLNEFLKNNDTIKDDENSVIASLMIKRMSGENINYYNEMPTDMQSKINNIILTSTMSGIKPKSKNDIAKMYLDEIIKDFNKSNSSDMDLELVMAEFDKDVKKIESDMASEFGTMMLSYDDERKMSIDAAIKRCEEEGKTESIEKLNKIKNTLDSAFNLTEFKEFCKTCKIKNFDLVKPSRTFESFNYKYEKHKNTINDIRQCPTILDRHIPEHAGNHNLMVCLAFCKFCQNKSPDNMDDHTFMYFFIRNIIMLDRLNPKGNVYESMNEKSKNFYDNFIANIKESISNLILKNVTLQ